VIPGGGEYLADYVRPQQPREKVIQDVEQSTREFVDVYRSIERQQRTEAVWYNASINPLEAESIMGIAEEGVHERTEFNKKVFPLKFALAEQLYRIRESYAVVLRKWSRLRDAITRPSPFVLYRNIVQAIAATDLGSYEIALQRARAYRDALMSYLLPKVGSPEWFTRALEYPDAQPTKQNQRQLQEIIEKQGERAVEKMLSWDRVTPLDLRPMPQPHIEFAGLAERLNPVMGDILLLVAGAALPLALSAWRIARHGVH